MNSNWYIDSGAKSHMCSDISLFQKFDETYKSQVTQANGHKLQVVGKGEILLRSNTEKKFRATNNIKLLNVLFVPELIGHIISVKVLTSKGYEVTFRDNKCVIIGGNQIITIATERLGLYELCLWTAELRKKTVHLYVA